MFLTRLLNGISRPIVLLHLAMCTLGIGCDRDNDGTVSSSISAGGEEVAVIVAELHAMPSWTSARTAEELSEIEGFVQKIAAHDLDAIARGVGTYWREMAQRQGDASTRSHDLVECYGKLFVVNKFLFDLPASVPTSSIHLCCDGGWYGRPSLNERTHSKSSARMDMRWPWSEDDTGLWRLTGRYCGFAGVYQPTVQFDYYREHFGRRALMRDGPPVATRQDLPEH